MANITGTVEQVLAGETLAKVQIKDQADGGVETFVLFNDIDAAVPDRVTQSLWLALCRDALLNGNSVTVATANANSALVASLAITRAAQP